MGVFADVGPLPVFVSNHVSLNACEKVNVDGLQLIPPDIKWDPNATPPQYTDNGDQVIEKGTQLRIKLIGTRSDVGSMFAIGSIREDFLGFVATFGLSVLTTLELYDHSSGDHVDLVARHALL